MKIHFEITTPERQFVKDEVDSVTAMTQVGELTILNNHIPLVVPVAPGEVRVKKDGEELYFAVAGGFLEVRRELKGEPHDTRATILADSAVRVEEIEEVEAEQARQRAKKAMEEYKTTDSEKFAEATAAFERALSQLHVARRRKARGQTGIQQE
ncbi:MAG: ATP synthase F1 subunit epsilon [Candidatus Terrybacteria bacterium RIFCSPHIGHO2_01_FULL_48_17]|uniref:ATP synthase epsilon chain n=1 Tax=Candidatus Terrybacteria bacterium RIFCSPHIGHO2_01_FULL_48_17 TaxID=1802362 RepID=A0A1G2PIN3_9BACT|nr:MAG: ATP synthase F1 subunit epsilon [Candidatus Terrybacteria bacterium RIFCSPHIGHO2_01_FULL_48_17]OHA52920.1 MAG: ATP synthase F1 subunit epsilon [Candidatus Terrybacteria bacterium RIFCSPLOWO2_01_FULL_48_14]